MSICQGIYKSKMKSTKLQGLLSNKAENDRNLAVRIRERNEEEEEEEEVRGDGKQIETAHRINEV